MTIYNQGYTKGDGALPAQAMNSYDMVASPGRTYRYFRGKPLFEFGAGLSLTTFAHSASCTKDTTTGGAISCSVGVRNTGAMPGDAVVMAFDSLSDDVRKAVGAAHPVPTKRLVDSDRATVPAGGVWPRSPLLSTPKISRSPRPTVPRRCTPARTTSCSHAATASM